MRTIVRPTRQMSVVKSSKRPSAWNSLHAARDDGPWRNSIRMTMPSPLIHCIDTRKTLNETGKFSGCGIMVRPVSVQAENDSNSASIQRSPSTRKGTLEKSESKTQAIANAIAAWRFCTPADEVWRRRIKRGG